MRPSAPGGCCSSLCACGARLPRRARQPLPRRRTLPRVGRRPLPAPVIVDYLRLALATAARAAAGRLVARALGQRGASATLAWALAALFVAWAVVFLVHGTIWLALGRPGGDRRRRSGRPRLPPAGPRPRPPARTRGACSPAGRPARDRCSGTSPASSPATGSSTWRACASSSSSATCTCGRSTSSRTAASTPGYAFPLWHGFHALVAKVSGLDPAVVVNHEASLLAPLACLVAWEAGVAVFGSAAAGFSVLAASARALLLRRRARRLVRLARAACDRVAAAARARPRSRSSSRYVESRRAGRSRRALAGGLRRARARPPDLRALRPDPARRLRDRAAGASGGASALALAAAIVPRRSSLLWLRPLVRETLSHNPTPAAQAAALAHYARELRSWSLHRFRLAAEARRPHRRRRGRRARARAARGLRRAAPLERVRARRDGRRPRADARPGALRALLATSSRSRSRAAPPGSSRSRSRSPAASRCSRASSVVAAGRARRRDRCSSAVARRLRLRPDGTAGPAP